MHRLSAARSSIDSRTKTCKARRPRTRKMDRPAETRLENSTNYSVYLEDLKRKFTELQKKHTEATANADSAAGTSKRSNYLLNEERYDGSCVYKRLIVFDYDDTILPTSWITVTNKLTLQDPIPAQMVPLFKRLSEVLIYTFNLCMQKGKLIIVTNASLEWCSNSARKYIPQVWAFIVKNRISVISARDQLIRTMVVPQNWKRTIFQQIISENLAPYLYDKSYLCCIYSVGDGNDERNACFSISQLNRYSSCIFRSLKFLSEPTCAKLIAEHELFHYFFNCGNGSPKQSQGAGKSIGAKEKCWTHMQAA